MNRNGSPNLSQGFASKEETRGTKRDFEEDDEVDSDDSIPKNEKRSGRRKIKIEYIDDKNRRHITFSKRKAGIMKKAYELSTLTGTQVLLLVVSETGLVYTFTTPKLQPLVTQSEGKNLIQSCLNAPDTTPAKESNTSISQSSQQTAVASQPAQSQAPTSKQLPSPPQTQRQLLSSQIQSQQTPPGYGGDTTTGVDPNSDNLYGNDRQNVRNLQQQSQPPTQGYNPSVASMNYGHQYGGLPNQIPGPIPMGNVGNYINTQQYPQYSQSHMGSYVPPNGQYMAQSNYWPNGAENTGGVAKSPQYPSHSGTSK